METSGHGRAVDLATAPGVMTGSGSPKECHDPEEYGEAGKYRETLLDKVKYDAFHQLKAGLSAKQFNIWP